MIYSGNAILKLLFNNNKAKLSSNEVCYYFHKETYLKKLPHNYYCCSTNDCLWSNGLDKRYTVHLSK